MTETRVEKPLYRRNARSYRLNDLLSSSPAMRGSDQAQPMCPFGDVQGDSLRRVDLTLKQQGVHVVTISRIGIQSPRSIDYTMIFDEPISHKVASP